MRFSPIGVRIGRSRGRGDARRTRGRQAHAPCCHAGCAMRGRVRGFRGHRGERARRGRRHNQPGLRRRRQLPARRCKNDYIELFNRSAAPVEPQRLVGAVRAAAGTTWQKTNLSGTLAPGAYYLVQEAAGTGGTTALRRRTRSARSTCRATAGKVALVANQTVTAPAPLPGRASPTSWASAALRTASRGPDRPRR